MHVLRGQGGQGRDLAGEFGRKRDGFLVRDFLVRERFSAFPVQLRVIQVPAVAGIGQWFVGVGEVSINVV